MKGKPTPARSYLRQLAEPIPRTVAPLIPRRPAAERGAATRSSLDAIPQIIDATGVEEGGASQPEHAQPASITAKRVPPGRTQTSARFEDSKVDATTSAPEVQAFPAKRSSAYAAETILRSNLGEHIVTGAKTQPLSPHENTPLKSVVAHSDSSEATSPLSAIHTQTGAKAERRPDISVRIGSIEVRVPAPPTRSSQPTPAGISPKNAPRSGSSRASEPLSRGLAWSHGLVQG
ncbi:MAG: hypothetical protein WCA10_07440 [Terracidiphilus sp.]